MLMIVCRFKSFHLWTILFSFTLIFRDALKFIKEAAETKTKNITTTTTFLESISRLMSHGL